MALCLAWMSAKLWSALALTPLSQLLIGRSRNREWESGVKAIPLANSKAGRECDGNVRQTSVCRWFPLLVHCRKPRQTEVCRTFWIRQRYLKAAALQRLPLILMSKVAIKIAAA
jgi:hypothetical protein